MENKMKRENDRLQSELSRCKTDGEKNNRENDRMNTERLSEEQWQRAVMAAELQKQIEIEKTYTVKYWISRIFSSFYCPFLRPVQSEHPAFIL
jgi:hypothetical protein